MFAPRVGQLHNARCVVLFVFFPHSSHVDSGLWEEIGTFKNFGSLSTDADEEILGTQIHFRIGFLFFTLILKST